MVPLMFEAFLTGAAMLGIGWSFSSMLDAHRANKRCDEIEKRLRKLQESEEG